MFLRLFGDLSTRHRHHKFSAHFSRMGGNLEVTNAAVRANCDPPSLPNDCRRGQSDIACASTVSASNRVMNHLRVTSGL